MSSYQSWFRRDDRLPLLNRDWHGPGRLVVQGFAIASEAPAGKREAPLRHPIGGFEGRFGERGFVSILV